MMIDVVVVVIKVMRNISFQLLLQYHKLVVYPDLADGSDDLPQ